MTRKGLKILAGVLAGVLICFKASWAAPILFSLPPENPHFVGRGDLLESLARGLEKNAIVALVGGPGFGKTQAAKRHAYKASGTHDIVWWFKADATLPYQLEKFAVALGTLLKPEDKIQVTGVSFEKLLAEVKKALVKGGLRCLFVFDEVENFEAVKPYLPNAYPKVRLVLTSRKKVMPHKTVTVDRLSPQESTVLIRQGLPGLKETEVQQMVARLGGHPLALVTAASFLALHPSVSVARYLASHELQREEKGAQVFVDHHERNLYVTLKTTLDALQKDHPDACQALKFLSLLHHTHIPFPYLVAFLKRMGIQEAADAVLSVLYNHSLVEVESSDSPESVRLSMHQLVHDLIKSGIPEAEQRQLLEKAISIVGEAFEGRNDLMNQKILSAPEHLMQAIKILEEAKCLNIHAVSVLSLRIRVLNCVACGQRDFEKAKELIEAIRKEKTILDALHTRGNALGGLMPFVPPDRLDKRDEALLEILLGFFEAAYSPNFDTAIAHYSKALDIFENLEGEPEQKIRSLTNLIQSYVLQGELSKAAPLIEKGKQLLSHSQSDVYNVFFLYGWAFFLFQMGNSESAVRETTQYDFLICKINSHPTVQQCVLF